MSSLANKTEFRFGTKAQTLERLKDRLTCASVPAFLYFTVGEWRQQREEIIARVQAESWKTRLIVRSSSVDEDGGEFSKAGQYDSVADVAATDRDQISVSVEQVIESYHRQRSSCQDDGILIQEMVDEVVMSGVLLTRDMNCGSPYYVINYDDQTGRTDTVTAGTEYSNRTLYVHRHSLDKVRSERFRALLRAAQEIENEAGSGHLDIEFAVDANLKVHLLQVRPITTVASWPVDIQQRVDRSLAQIGRFLDSRFGRISGVYGSRSILGQMPDWNPAEMIGRVPRPLAMSLYRKLITDRAWRQARNRMGYAEPHGMPLMLSLAGQPYIDVRLSFHSYLPRMLPPPIAEKLVNAWLDKLEANPHLHDKVEFDVALTCLTPDFDERLQRDYPDLLQPAELEQFRSALTCLTQGLLEGKVAPISEQMERIQRLEILRKELFELKGNPDLAAVTALLEDCIELGTIPFSILARHAFIAQSFLRALVSQRVISEQESLAFQRSIRTVASELADDTVRLIDGEMERGCFMERYGHLRPGTYDILSPRYDQREDLFDGLAGTQRTPVEQSKFRFSDSQQGMMVQLLSDCGLDISAGCFLDYIKKAVASREYAKFIFTHNISDALEVLTEWGRQIGIDREDISYLEIDDILDTLTTSYPEPVAARLHRLAANGRHDHEVANALRLPQILCEANDAYVVPLRLNQPNFITRASVRGQSWKIEQHSAVEDRIVDRLVLIESADPGFDWIFAYPIKGLITKYGGANSHMAIRCAEFGIPAAIGCGEQIFDRLQQSSVIELNCSEGIVRPVSGQG